MKNSLLLILLSAIAITSCSIVADPLAATLDFDDLRGDLSEAAVMDLHPRLDWLCTTDESVNRGVFGQRVCDASATSINGVPATRIDYLFRDGSLSFAIIEYKPNAFIALKEKMDSTYSESNDNNDHMESLQAPLSSLIPTGTTKGLTRWMPADGMVITAKDGKNVRGNVFILWISSKEIARAIARQRN